MRVLVTGADGFTGRYVTAALTDAGHEVVPFAADVTDGGAVAAALRRARPNGVIHLAARAFVHSDEIAPFYLVNQIGTFNLLQASADHAPGAPVLVASSANIYGNATAGVLSEDSPPQPVNHYAASKLAMEVGARLWADRVPLTIVRPFNYTGRGQETRYLIAKIVDHFVRRAPVLSLGNTAIRRDIGDVRAVASAYLGLIEGRHSGTFNICSGHVTSPDEVIALCTRLTGHRLTVERDPALVRDNEVAVLSCNAQLLRATLPDWKAIPLTETLEWMLSHAP